MFGLWAHIDVTTCDIYGIRIFFSLPMLWDSALLSLLVNFANSDIRITSFLIPPGVLLLNPLLSRVVGVLTQVPDRGSPFSFRAGRTFSGTNSCGQQFSCGVIDIALAMSRHVFLTAVCAPPTESFFLNFYDVMLPDFRLILCADVYVLYDYSYISAPPLVVALPHACFLYLAKL